MQCSGISLSSLNWTSEQILSKPYSGDTAAAVNIEVFVRHVTFFTKVFIMDLHFEFKLFFKSQKEWKVTFDSKQIERDISIPKQFGKLINSVYFCKEIINTKQSVL